MIRSQTFDKGRRVADRKAVSLSQDTAKLLKTQDAGYLNMIAQKTNVARCNLEQEYLMQKSINPASKDGEQNDDCLHHKYRFVSSLEHEMPVRNHSKKDPRSAHVGKDRDKNSRDPCPGGDPGLSLNVQDRSVLPEEEDILRRTWRREQELRESKLNLLRKRQKEIRIASEAVEHQRDKMANKVGGVTSTGLKWKVRERRK